MTVECGRPPGRPPARHALLVLGAACLLVGPLPACRRDGGLALREAGRLGAVRVYRPAGTPQALVFVLSDRDGWSPGLDALARPLAARGAAVVGVDLPQYLRGLAASDDGCHYVLSELEELSHRLQREWQFPAYRSPIVAGVGAGGTLAYAALAQAPAATLEGGLGPEVLPALPTRVPLCPGARAKAAAGGGFRYARDAHLPGWWQPISVGPRFLEELQTAIEGHLPHAAPPETPEELSDLPLTEVRAAHPGGTMAVIYSGDGGWRDLDKQIAEVLASEGMPVVGVDCLRYFWRRREPEVLARDLERIVRHYGAAWEARRVVLVGYSFGAGVLPFVVNRLTPDVHGRVALVSLLGLGPQAAFEFHVADWFGVLPQADARDVLPELLALDRDRLQCVYGADEEDTLCRTPELAGAEIIRTAGGHHFDGDYRALAARILDGARRRGLGA